MDVKEAIQKRQSVRSFLGKKLSLEVIHEIIKYAHLAPSAGNLQARDFIIVDDEEQKRRLSRASLNQMFIAEAPVNIVVCANLNRVSPYGIRGEELYCIQDSAAAVEHILLLAVDNGLGACWVGAFNENEVSNILELPQHIRPVAIIPIGYPLGKTTNTSRIDTKILTHYNKW
ncbi:MAG: nitroreductase family protein [Thermoplasmatales archaeon]|nr:MAG: nitroreductase family protein [Thermoplasmatales archaeon]